MLLGTKPLPTNIRVLLYLKYVISVSAVVINRELRINAEDACSDEPTVNYCIPLLCSLAQLLEALCVFQLIVLVG